MAVTILGTDQVTSGRCDTVVVAERVSEGIRRIEGTVSCVGGIYYWNQGVIDWAIEGMEDIRIVFEVADRP